MADQSFSGSVRGVQREQASLVKPTDSQDESDEVPSSKRTKLSSQEAFQRSVDPAAMAGKAFKKLFSNLCKAVTTPSILAAELYSSDIISEATMDVVSDTSGSRTATQKTVIMLREVQGWLERDGRNLSLLLTVLGDSSALTHDFADRLQENYLQCLVKATDSQDESDGVKVKDSSLEASQSCITEGVKHKHDDLEHSTAQESFVPSQPPVSCYSGDLSISDPSPYLDSIKTFAVYLKSIYSRNHENKWPQFTSFDYNNLAAVLKHRISSGSADEFTIATLYDGIDRIFAAKEPIEMEEILKPLEEKRKINFILVEGPPGVGKSMFALELCRRWDDIENLKIFPLVVLLRLRDKCAQEARSLSDIFYHPDDNVQKDVTKAVLKHNGKGLLLILDGFDEFPESHRKDSLLLDIIKGKKLPAATVIVTSRPTATADLLKSCRVDKHIEVLGFTQKEIEKYATKAFAHEPKLLRDFHTYQNINPAIRSMMYIPLNTAIVTDIFLSNGKPVSHTVTDLYVEVIIILWKRHLKDIGQDELAESLSTKLDELPPNIKSVIVKLGELAFKGTVNQEVIFKELPSDCKKLDFMNESPELYVRSNPTTSYNFLHKSFQDLFTAIHISRLPPEEQKELFLKYFKKEERNYAETISDDPFKEVWRFLAGLTKFDGISWDVVKAESSTHEIVSYLYEAQDIAACDYVLEENNRDFMALHLFDCFAVGWCIAATKCSFCLRFDFLDTTAEICEMFASGVKSQKEIHGFVSELIMQHKPIDEKDVDKLLSLPSSIWQRLSVLYLAHCQLNRPTIDKLAVLVQKMQNLKYLTIYGNDIGNGGLVQLCNSLLECTALSRIDIGGNSISCADVEALAKLIHSRSVHLKEVMIADEINMSVTCQKLLIEIFLSASELEVIRLCNVDFDASVWDCFSQLEDNHNLVAITIREIGQTLQTFLKALEHNKSVKKLTIDDFGIAFASPMAEMLRKNNCLQSLTLQIYERNKQHRCNLCHDVINALKDNYTLENLVLSGNESLNRLFSHGELLEMDPRVELK